MNDITLLLERHCWYVYECMCTLLLDDIVSPVRHRAVFINELGPSLGESTTLICIPDLASNDGLF